MELGKMRKISFVLRGGNSRRNIEVPDNRTDIINAIRAIDKDNRINWWYTMILRHEEESVSDWLNLSDSVWDEISS